MLSLFTVRRSRRHPRADQSAAAPARVHPGADLRVDEFYVHVPAGAQEPLTALVVLHGMGGNGEDSSRPLIERADAERWVIVAPTFQYGDWRDPAQLTREAGAHMPRIAAFLDRLPELTGLSVRKDALFYGFSRGGQTANRFALCYPERVAGVAMVSSGTYTLPLASLRSNDGDVAMPFPYGVSNFADLFGGAFDSSRFASVPFWVAVGSRDSDPADVPQQWSRLHRRRPGRTRRAFHRLAQRRRLQCGSSRVSRCRPRGDRPNSLGRPGLSERRPVGVMNCLGWGLTQPIAGPSQGDSTAGNVKGAALGKLSSQPSACSMSSRMAGP